MGANEATDFALFVELTFNVRTTRPIRVTVLIAAILETLFPAVRLVHVTHWRCFTDSLLLSSHK